MKKHLLIATLLGLFFSIVAQTNQTEKLIPEQSKSLIEIDDFITDYLESVHKPGLSACIIKGDSVVWRGNYGFANVAEEKPVSKNSLFYAYSIGKSITAASVMQLWQDGLLGLDENINDFLPFQIDNPNFPMDSITPRMLMTHTSSILDDDISDHATIGDSPTSLAYFLMNYLSPGGEFYSSSNFSSHTPGTYYNYSNYGSALNGYLAEVITNQLFKTYAGSSLLTPLEMENSAWMLDDIDLDLLASGYQYNGSQYIPYQNYGHPAYPGLTLKTSSEDLSHYVMMLMNEGIYNNEQILEPETIDTMRVNYIYEVGLGLYKQSLQCATGGKIVWGHKGGGTRGYASDFEFCPDQNLGVIYMSNSQTYVNPILIKLFEYGALIVIPENATDTTSNSFMAHWQEAPDAFEYYMDVSTDWQFYNLVEGYDNFNVGLVTSYEVDGLESNTNYWYRIRAHNGIEMGPTSSAKHIITLSPTGINSKTSLVESFTCNPNPVKDKIEVGYFTNSTNNLEIVIYNIEGQIMMTTSITKSLNNQNEVDLNLSELPPGIYFLRLQAGNEVVVKKVVKL